MPPTPPHHVADRRPPGLLGAILVLILLLAGLGDAQVAVTVPDTAVARGGSVSLPVRLADPAPTGVVSVEVFVAFDSEALTYQGLSAVGGLTEAWLLDSVLVEAGSVDTLKVLAATAADTARWAGTLFWLDFLVADSRDPVQAAAALTYVLLNDGSPAAVALGGSVVITGTDGSLGASPDTVLAGGTVQVTIADVDEDRGGGIDSVSVRVTNGTQVEVFRAPETGATTGEFGLGISVVASGTQPSGDGIVQAQPGDHLAFCYDDVLDAAGTTVARCAAVEVAGATFGVDGTVSATRVVEPGDTVWVRVVDADLNIGAGVAETAAATVENPGTGEIETVTLTETGADTDVFLGRAYTAYGTAAGTLGDGVVLIQKGDAVRVTYEDFATVSGSPEPRQADVVVIDPFGDVSGNGTVRGFDASLILDHSVGTITLSGGDSLAANLDQQAPMGPITAFDASLVLQYRVGLLQRFPVRERSSSNHPQPEAAAAPRPVGGPRLLALTPVGGGEWALTVDDRAGIVAAEVLVAGFSGRVIASPEAGQFLVAWRQTTEGLRIALAAAEAAAGPGELVRLVPQAGDGTPQLVAAHLNDGQVPTVLGARPGASATPSRFRLLANHPNPFNPETVIGFEIATAGPVELDVLNPLGQTVRHLARDWRPPGTHQVLWDSRDEAGAPVAGGVYFYRLVTPTHRAVRRMTLLK